MNAMGSKKRLDFFPKGRVKCAQTRLPLLSPGTVERILTATNDDLL